MIYHAFLIKYAEIAIKGKNRYLFEDALVKQMNIALSAVEGDFGVSLRSRDAFMYSARKKYDYEDTVAALKKGIWHRIYLPCCDL